MACTLTLRLMPSLQALAQADAEHLESSLHNLVEYLRRTSPVVAKFLTMHERMASGAAAAPGHPPVGAVPVLPAAALGPAIAATQARDPRATAPAAGGNNTITATMDFMEQVQANEYVSDAMFSLGQVQARPGADPAAEPASPRTILGTAEGYSQRDKLSIDGALFPFQHPRGLGTFLPGRGLKTLLAQRMQQLLSPFTLAKEYLLLMFQVRRIAPGSRIQHILYLQQSDGSLRKQRRLQCKVRRGEVGPTDASPLRAAAPCR